MDACIYDTKFERPDIADAHAEAEYGRADTLVAKELSRVGRPAEASTSH
jgi:DNA invertase Pin-like site-specific DNA recombinase